MLEAKLNLDRRELRDDLTRLGHLPSMVDDCATWGPTSYGNDRLATNNAIFPTVYVTSTTISL